MPLLALYRPTWGPGVHASANLLWFNSNTPLEDHPFAARREPSAQDGRIRPSRFFSRSFRPFCRSFPQKGTVFAYVGGDENLKNLKDGIDRISLQNNVNHTAGCQGILGDWEPDSPLPYKSVGTPQCPFGIAYRRPVDHPLSRHSKIPLESAVPSRI